MLSLLIISLTLLIICSIIIVTMKKRSKYFVKVVYTQSSIHQIVKHFLPKDLFDLPKRSSQARKHLEKDMIRIVVTEDKAYWIDNNMFYEADTFNGSIDSESVRPIDTNNMSKRDIEKMLSILDSLRNGNSDDSSSTWNG